MGDPKQAPDPITLFSILQSKSDQCKKVINQAAADFGRLDVFIANAGAGGPGPITEMEDDAWDKCVGTNYSSVFYCAREAGKIWQKQVAEGKPAGRFIATSSISGRGSFCLAKFVFQPVDHTS